MAIRKSSKLLPSLFQTDKNKKFLNATLDQLISEPNLQRVSSFIGRKFAPNFTVGDGYIQESTTDRQNYQLEPAVVYKTPNKQIESLTGYQDFVNLLKYNNVDTASHSDLFNQDYYNYSGFVDLDKLVNYGEYFWLPAGPDSVQVFNSIVDTERDYTVFRNGLQSSFEFDSADADPNPTLILARGGTYTFEVQQNGNPFWIQTEQGTSGISSYSSSTSTREVLGVTNNGDDNGTITFVVPTADAQNDEINATLAANPDFATTLTYRQIHNQPYSTFITEHGGIDKQTIIDGKSLVFVNTTTDEDAWDQGALFDAYGFDDDNNPFDETTVLDMSIRYDVYAIEVNTIGGVDTIQLRRSADWPVGEKVKIKQGDGYGNREFFKDASGVPKLIAPYTAGVDVLYYQDGNDANRFGRIKLVEIDTIAPVDVNDDIIGKQRFTSSNGVTFTNGLKVEFNSDVTPSMYADREYYIEGVGQPQGISLTPVDELVTAETYTTSSSDGFDTVAYDTGGWDGTLNAPTTQDYIVINRASPDRNAWSRGNRWFHREVIEATAAYNGYTVTIDGDARAKRPIVEFAFGLELFNMGTSAVAPVTVVDTSETDALSNVNGTTGYFADGIDLQQGNTVVFTADTDADVRNKVYRVDFIDQDSSISTNPIINLVAITDIVDGNCVLSSYGSNNQGLQYWLEDGTWTAAQQKTKINQDPLFDVFDPDHVSFSNITKYPSSNFTGSKLFSYKRNNNASPDSVLSFGLTYQNFSTLGDIVFENNFDKDTFQYTKSIGNVNVIVRSGHVHQFDAQGARTLYNGWTKVLDPSFQYQIVSHDVKDTELYSFEIGASVDTNRTIEPLQVFANGKFIPKSQYTHLVQYGREYIVFTNSRTVNDTITIKFYSTQKAANSFYEVPKNLENNAGNATFDTLTLGQVRNHTVTLSQHIKDLTGVAPGKSNLRDKNFKAYPGNIMQHSAGMKLPMYAMSNETTNAIKAMVFVKNEYSKFKNKFIDNIDKLDLDLTDPAKCVDDIITFMAGKKTSSFPFYYSDMLPWGTQKSQLVYTIDDVTETDFEFATQFDLTSISNQGVLVYHNTTLLIEGKDYTFDTEEAKIHLTVNNLGTSRIGIAVNDTIKIVEYTDTNGSFAPPTPSVMGIYYKFEPRKYTDTTYKTAKTVIQGHDGSKYVGWGDLRDDVLFEYEKRVYNNIKTQYNRDLFDFCDFIPGYFRATLDFLAEANNITRGYYGEWALRNRVRTQPNAIADGNDPFTWNYRNGVNKLNKQRVPGYWRAIYRWFYDTDTPHTTPWEMLGLSTKPSWWDARYGEAPYTGGNTVMWEDIRDGKIHTDATSTTHTVKLNRTRPDLMSIIPVDAQGNLLAPGEFLMEDSNKTNIKDGWAYSDGSPAETAWVRSSEYPFVLQIMALNLQPAKYGTLMFDTNLNEYNSAYDQILQKGKSYRPGIADFKMHGQSDGDGDIIRVEGYNQFIAEYLRSTGFSIDDAITKINNLELNLCYGLAGFSDKKYLKVIAESITPSAETENIFIPDEDLFLYMKKSLPLERVVYSGVQIIRRADGYEIQGYDTENPFFKVIPSARGNDPKVIQVGETTYFEYTEFENKIISVPYGTVIPARQQVFDFLVAYQRYLLSRGFVFDGTTGTGEKNDFVSAGKEFAFWTDQKWQEGSVIVISPYSENLTLNRAFTTVDDIVNKGNIKDANSATINPKYYDVTRSDNITTINIDPEATQLYSVQLDPVQYEHVLVFNNKTIFNDIIYQPELGNRHSRLKLVGSKSGDWNGTMHAPGFFINEDKINIWETYTDYKKGDIVSFQSKTYVAKYSVAGSKTFDYNDWTVADNMQTGMVKNLSNKANEFTNYFELDNLNLEDGVDKLGKGIIGFNNKSYLAGLGLDDVSQVKFYQGMIKQKGTSTAINKLIDAELTNLDQTIDFFEEWASRVGEYGSISSNQVIETIIPEEQATNNPFVLHFHADGDLPADDNITHYHVQRKDLYKTPENYTGHVFAKRGTNGVTLKDLDSAVYARLDDVDFTAFGGDQLESLSGQIGILGKGKKIWVATDTTNTWAVRRIDEVLSSVTSVASSGNGYLVYTTDINHGLVKDDYVIIRAQQPIGKVAKIYSVDAPNKFTIADATTDADIQDVSLPMYKLSNVRFTQASDMASYTPVSGWDNKELVWVDKDTNGDWSVLQNSRPWTTTGTKTNASVTANDNLGTSVAVNKGSTLAVVGAPNYGTGLITPYVRSEGGTLLESNSVTVTTIGDSVDGFGASVAAGDEYVAVGASETQSDAGAVFLYYIDSAGTFNRRPSIRPSDITVNDKFGTRVVLTGNGRYLFASAPGANKVYAYAFVDIPTSLEKSFTISTTGAATYSLDFVPQSLQALNIVDENGKVYLPNKDFTLSHDEITFTSTPASGLDIVVRQQDYFAQVSSFSGHDSLIGDNFGFSLDADYTGETVAVGAPQAAVPNTTSTVLGEAGEAYVFSQVVETFVGNGSTKVYTTGNDLQAKIFVEVDGVLQVETDNTDTGTDNEGSTQGFYTRSGNTITFKFTPTNGSSIKVCTGTFTEKQRLTQTTAGDTITEGERFGHSIAIDSKGGIVAVGSPGEDETNPNTGSVFVFQDTGKNYGSVTGSSNHTQTAGDILYINGYKVVVGDTSSDANDLKADINDANIPLVTASVNSVGSLVISSTSDELETKLRLVSGTGQMFIRDTVIAPFTFTQKINHPQGFENENFGNALAFDKHIGVGTDSFPGTRNLVISSDRASTMLAVGFDVEDNSNSENYLSATTTYDGNGTTFTDRRTQSGAAYIYELMNAYNESATNPSKLVFGQQLTSTNVNAIDQFGASVAFSDNRVFVGSPGDDTTRGTTNLQNSGSVYEFNNNLRTASWQVLRSEGNRVDVDQINRVALYNKKSGEISVFLDYIDPAKGKIAGVAKAELDYISHNDPCLYDNNIWNYKQEYRLWWDTSTVHYLNAEQGNIDFRTNYWAQSFPGSSIDIYEWMMSDVPPDQYNGEGFVKDLSKFTTAIVYDPKHNHTRQHWFFWVGGRTSIPAEAGFRTLSADSVKALIEDPKAQGLPYAAFLDTDAIALFNCKQYFADKDVVLSVNYDVVKNEGVLHSEFELYGRGNIDQSIPTRIYNKLVDSLAGSDSVGNIVPDPFLSEVEKYGVLTQPRQGMFVNRASALKVLVQYCNSIFATAPFARNADLSKLLSSENIPTVNSGEYNISVDNIEERDFLNTATLSTGYKVLVLEDSTNSDYWTIYELQSDKTWLLANIQGYNTQDYWSYKTYYSSGYDSTTVPKYQVTLEADLLTLTQAVTGDIAKVTSNDEGNFSMFCKKDTGWDEVIIERGTLALNASLYSFAALSTALHATGFDNDGFDFAPYDKIPADEIRQIIKAIKEDLFIDTFATNMNELFFRLMEYALNETTFTQDWIFKTSFLSVAHKIRSLDQYNTFKYDNTNFIEDFIEEVKPYKTKIREYISKYDKIDPFEGDTTDFDIHPFYDEDLGYFRKPSGEYAGDEITRTQGLNKPWGENYGYRLDDIVLVNAGSGYIDDPIVTISAPQLAGGIQAVATAKSNGDTIVSITVTNKGSGYTQNPTITITGSGTGCIVSPRLTNSTTRSFDTTIKFDRITYSSSIKDWAANTAYTAGDIVAYQNTKTKTQEVYTVAQTFTSGTTFSVENASGITVLTVKADADFTNTADRIAAYYYPTTGMIGDDLELLQKGTGYLGNKVLGAGFDQNPGFDSGNFDTVAFDALETDEDGLEVLGGLIDTNISSLFTDLALGTRPEDINVDGGKFVDTYNSHAPEELVPGRVYDTLDMEVYTHASQDYEKDGNAPVINYISYTDGDRSVFSYGDPAKSADDFEYILVYKNTTRVYDFTIDFNNKNVILATPLSGTDVLHIYAYGVTGEKIVGEYTFTGDGSTANFVLANTPDVTQQTLVYVDGVETTISVGSQDARSVIKFPATNIPVNGAHIHVTVYNQAEGRDAPSKVALQTVNLTAGTSTYDLDNTVNYAQPFSANVVVDLDGVRLRPANSKYHTGDGSTTQFAISTTSGETTIGNFNNFGVALIKKSDNQTTNMIKDQDYTIVNGDDFVTLNTAPADGDTVIVYNTTDAEYFIDGAGDQITIAGDVTFNSSSVLRVTTFANHDPVRIQTKVHVGKGTGSIVTEDAFDEVLFDSGGFDRESTTGITGTYSLDRTVTNVNNFWVTVDGVRLHPGDYEVSGTDLIMSTAQRDAIDGTSVVVITHISENRIQPSTGFRIFQDMNGEVEYLRLAKDATTFTTETVDKGDTKIYVDDVSKLPFVTASSEHPGVVFIGNERVTYTVVSRDDNYISGLRRGTAGTQIYTSIAPGFLVVDGSRDQYLPDNNTHTKTWYDLGESTAADGLGLQQSTTTNANFLREKEAQVPNYRLELNEKLYMVADYVEDDYVEELL